MINNEWFDRGELPPIGSHLEVTFGNKSVWHECVVLPGKKIAIDRYAGWRVMQWQDDFEFRTIKSERENAIDEVSKEIRKVVDFCDEVNSIFKQQERKIAEAIYEKFIKKDEM